jgi:hypothetical protein
MRGDVLGLTNGEWVVVAVLSLGIVSAKWWPAAAEWVAARLTQKR